MNLFEWWFNKVFYSTFIVLKCKNIFFIVIDFKWAKIKMEFGGFDNDSVEEDF